MANAVTTEIAKKKILLARAGVYPLSKIAKMAFGTGGVDGAGNVLEIGEGQQGLNAEIFRKDVDGYEIINDTKVQYRCTLTEEELAGEQLSELALVDSDGDFVAIKNFTAKGKDIDWKMTIKINDTM